MSLENKFVWGAASAAYQIEGSWNADGKGLSIWDVFAHTPGRIWRNQNGDIACDHYNRYKKDINSWSALGLDAYRFSISWPRILPNGTGKINDRGLAFYDKLVDELLSVRIQPYVTLFHWDYPYELYLRGGWLNRESADWFADYARVVVSKISDRVNLWITINEPNAIIGAGHSGTVHAPGLGLGNLECARAVHNMLLAHGKAVQVIRAEAKTPPRIGFTPSDYPCWPSSETHEDIEAARGATFSPLRNNFDNDSCWLDPIFFGAWNEDLLEKLGKSSPRILSGDMKIIGEPVDFCGVNIYYGHETKAGRDGQPELVPQPSQRDLTAQNYAKQGWEVHPQVLYWGPKFLFERYGKPVYIFENGMCNRDWVSEDGRVHDPQRIEYLSRYLGELERARNEGVDIAGYFYWSIMDDFEWPNGYSQRFGLIYVNFETQERILKDSAYWYRDYIAGKRAQTISEPPQVPEDKEELEYVVQK